MMRIYCKSLALLALVTGFGLSSAQAASGPEESWLGHRLEGSWVFKISLQDCTLKTPIGAPFLSLLTFNEGGTVTETTSNSMFFPAVRGPGHGVWKRAGWHTFDATTTAFVTLNGVLTRTQTITQTIVLEGENSLKTTGASVKFFSPDGALLATGCAEATGTRIVLE